MTSNTPKRFSSNGTKRKELTSSVPQSTLEELIASHVESSLEKAQFEAELEGLHLGEAVRAARKAQGISQTALSQRIGMSKSYLSRLESNAAEARISTLRKVVEEGLGGKLRVTIELPGAEGGT